MVNSPQGTSLPTVTVLQSYTAATPDGRIAIVLVTKEAGTIAFELNTEAIAAIRRELATAEQFLAQTPKNPKPN